MEKRISVGLGELHVSNDSHLTLIAHGLGSCVGVAAYDKINKVGGMLHVMLPNAGPGVTNCKRAKYADSGIPLLFEEIEKLGGRKKFFVIKIAGGARMFNVQSNSSIFDIGDRNIETVKYVLGNIGVSVHGEDLGLNYGRTMHLFMDTGKVLIRTFGKGEKEI